MLPKIHRYPIKTHGVLRSALKTPLFNVGYAKNDLGIIRASIVVSKKVSTKATDRNRLRRLISHILQGKNLRKEQGFDLVFFVKKDIVEKDVESIEKEIDSTLSRIYGTI